KERSQADDYFLAGRSLPWYVVGTSFIASNISTEHFIGMIGAAYIFGIAPAVYEWSNVASFTLLIWLFIPFLLASRVFTTPEYMEQRFGPSLRLFFAIVTVISNVVAFLAAVLYGGALGLQELFGWDLWPSIIGLGLLAGIWAIYGGLKSVAWSDFMMMIVMIAGGILVTVLALYDLSGEERSLVSGIRVMIERNQAEEGEWKEAVAAAAPHITGREDYNRLSVIQPASHTLAPWPFIIFGVFSLSIWYNVCNQFMIQRVLGAKNMYHARMGIVLAGYMKILLPLIIVVPGLALFARNPGTLLLPWDQVRPEADKGYIRMLQEVVPVGLRGLYLAALFGAIQSTVNSVLNSTATVFTLDVYKRSIHRNATDRQLVIMGVISSTVFLTIAIVLGGFIKNFGTGLFDYIQALYAFFGPPFASVFLLGILVRRINANGAIAGVLAGFAFGIITKIYVETAANPPEWLVPFPMQAIANWAFCTIVCIVVSLATKPPLPHQVTSALTLNWSTLNIFSELGDKWYLSVVLWWGLFVAIVLSLFVGLSGLFI
ncbi:MAG TPA: sodium/solute symporter, partial [Candidatus Hydrogenedentes bacterium]|nr:sodium/solute symporter [Candidatus Hydrogenedentota bacterium]